MQSRSFLIRDSGEAKVRLPGRTFDRSVLAAIDEAIIGAIRQQQMPGAVVRMEQGRRLEMRAYGERCREPQPEPCTADTIYDVASLTKVVATTPAVMRLVEQGRLDLDRPVADYWPEFGQGNKVRITARHLLTHTSGLRPGLPSKPEWQGYAQAMSRVIAEEPGAPPGVSFRYSDINFIALGELVRRLSGRPLDEFVAQHLFRPLRMEDTGFLPPPDKRVRIAPTERVEGKILRGTVHDPTARRMGGVAGHAGLFSTALDLGRYARMLLQRGELDGVRVFQPETVAWMTRLQYGPDLNARRGLGWDMDTGYSHPRGDLFPLGSFGHTGWTGCCLWVDPFSGAYWLMLANRVYPDGRGNVLKLERQLGTLVAQAAGLGEGSRARMSREESNTVAALPVARLDLSSSAKEKPDVLNGIDVLEKNRFTWLRGKRVGLITNQTGRNRRGVSTIDLLFRAPGVRLVALFSPEHGLRGDRDERVEDSRDERTGLPVYSLYGENRRPSAVQLENLDVLVFDIQDIGCRFYTYISTLLYAMEAASEAGIGFVVLDRINPIGGQNIDGPVVQGDFSFVACHCLPVVHGLTVGELARLFQRDKALKLDLTIVPVEGWSRAICLDETGLPWVNPSPNIRSLTAALLYPGVGLLEMTRLSVGRGTDTPFEIVGAPYIEERVLADSLGRESLPGLAFAPVRFTPSSSVFAGESCGGVRITIHDRRSFNSINLAIALARILFRLYPERWDLDRVNVLLVHPPTIEAIRSGKTIDQIRPLWEQEVHRFRERQNRILIYR